MFKSKLQEYCQSKRWSLPEYSITREGQDHCPQFKATVTVNGTTFTTPNFSKSSKEAHNLVASIACQRLLGSSITSTALQVWPTSVDAQQPKTIEPLQATSFSVVNTSNRDDKKSTGCSTTSTPLQVWPTSVDAQQPKTIEPLQATSFSIVNTSNTDDKKSTDMTHLCKNQLQTYAQKRNLNLPIYITEREGPPHVCRFKSKVMLEGKTYETFEFFSTIKDAENAAAKVALMSVSSDVNEEEDSSFFKNLLQELAQKEYSCLPAYVTTRSGPSHNPVFSSTVQINELFFTGQEAKTKKLAEMNAAKIAYITLRERKGELNPKTDLLGYHVNDAPYGSSPKFQLAPVAELPDKHISVPDPISNRVHMEQVRCSKGAYQQDTEAEYAVVKAGVQTNFDQNICGLKSDSLSFEKEPSRSPIQSHSRSGDSEIHQASASSPNSSSQKKIKVLPVTPDLKLPAGATVMHRDEKWIAVFGLD